MSGFGRVPVFDEEWGDLFLKKLNDYMQTLEAFLDVEGLDPDIAPDLESDVETISGEPFCGCSDCYERESYLMAAKLVIEGYEAGRIRLEDPDA
jgi:hypothetical protein